MNKHWKNVLILCVISILVELIVIYVTEQYYNSFIDKWGFRVYFETIVIPFSNSGQLPYINYFWEYPILMTVPVFLAAIPSLITRDAMLFFIAFPMLMVICNLVTTVLIYYTTLKIYNNSKRAFIAGFLYATAITAAYFTLTNFDTMPAMLMMAGIYLTVKGKDTPREYGYLAYILGFFTKIYTIAILPFLILFNAKSTGLKQEIWMILKVGIPAFLILFVPIYLINPNMVDTYLIKNASGKETFVSSFVYTVYAWLHSVLGLPITDTNVAMIMTTVLVGTIGLLIWLAYSYKGQDAIFLLQVTLIALVAIIACSKYHSPQYMIWFTPILCILVAGDLFKMLIFYLLQGIWYIKFPLTFWTIWTNGYYVTPLPKSDGFLALFLFTIEYLILFYLVWKTTASTWVWHVPFRVERK